VREREFRAWLTAQGYKAGTVNTQMSKVRKLDRAFGDLDALPQQGAFDGLDANLKSGADLPDTLGNDGERRHLPTSLGYYRKFIEAEGAIRGHGLSQQDVLSAIDRCDSAGSADAFVSGQGLGMPRKFWLLHLGKRYPSKAIVHDALAHTGMPSAVGEDAAVLQDGPYWFVGASYGRRDDQVERFLAEGIWDIADPSCQFAPNVVPPFALNVSPAGAGVCSRPAV